MYGIEPGVVQDLPHDGSGAAMSESDEFALRPTVSPGGLLGHHPDDSFLIAAAVGGRPSGRRAV
jgi:hypothetical protein